MPDRSFHAAPAMRAREGTKGQGGVGGSDQEGEAVVEARPQFSLALGDKGYKV